MAISPRSRGLGNIGSIVNRQGMASPTRPTRPAPMPTPKLAPQMSMPIQRPRPNPFQSAMVPMAPQPAPEPFNPNPNPGQMPIDYSGMQPQMQPQMQPMDMFGGNPQVDYGGMNMFGMQPMQQPMDMFGGMNPTVDYGGMNQLQAGQQMAQIGQGGLGQMFGAPTVDTGGPAGQQPGQMFGNPNPLTSDYDELEGPGFNTNPSMGGSLFGGGGFSGY